MRPENRDRFSGIKKGPNEQLVNKMLPVLLVSKLGPLFHQNPKNAELLASFLSGSVSVCLSICLSVYLSACLCLSVHLSVCLCTCLSVCLPLRDSIPLSCPSRLSSIPSTVLSSLPRHFLVLLGGFGVLLGCGVGCVFDLDFETLLKLYFRFPCFLGGAGGQNLCFTP